MSATPEQLNDREKKESPPPSPEREQTARETGEKMRQEGDRLTDDVMTSIDSAWDMAETASDPAAEQRLEGLRGEATEAKEQLEEDIDALFADDEATTPETAEPAELSPEEFEAVQEAGRMTEDILNMEDDYFDGLDALAEAAAENANKRAEILKVMKERLGNKAAEILDSPELRAELADMKERLSGRWGGENGPPIATELTLVRLTALRETIGKDPEAFLSVIDIKQRLESAGTPSDAEYLPIDIIRIQEPIVDEKTGELITTIETKFAYDHPSIENMTISREFKRTVDRGKDGKPVVRKSVEHVLFELPSTLKAGGIAADITRDSLAEYDKQDVDEVTLHADIDMGGYAWAAYGYGWDKKEMAADLAKPSKKSEIEVSVGDKRKKLMDLSPQEREEVLETQAEAIALEAVIGVVKNGRSALEDALKKTDHPDTETLLAEYDALAENPLTVTPQTLAEFGRGGPKFFKDMESGWLTEDGVKEEHEKRVKKVAEEIVAQGRDALKEILTEKKSSNIEALLSEFDALAENPHSASPKAIAEFAAALDRNDPADVLKNKPFHAGKIALAGNDWHGKIDLKADGEQGGMNRKALENYLAKSSQKKP